MFAGVWRIAAVCCRCVLFVVRGVVGVCWCLLLCAWFGVVGLRCGCSCQCLLITAVVVGCCLLFGVAFAVLFVDAVVVVVAVVVCC